MFTKEEIVKEIKRIAEKLGVKTLKQQDFVMHSTIPINTVKYSMGTWNQALEEAGLDKSDSSELAANKDLADDDELLSELVRLYNVSGKVPTAAIVNARGKWGEIYYQAKWKSLEQAFKVAREKFPDRIQENSEQSEDLLPGEFILKNENEKPKLIKNPTPEPKPKPVSPENESPKIKFIPQTIKPHKVSKKPRNLGNKIEFRGLKYAPVNREGVIFLFGMIAIELGFLIEGIANDYPAADARRCIDIQNQRWEDIKIEFTFKSSDFEEQAHPEGECDMIVCWTHDRSDCPLEILELKSIINNLDNYKNI